MTIREQIIEANKAYRLGRPVMTDQAFDDLCEAYEKTVSPEEYAAFRDSLHEETGKVSHPFIMGSLDKMEGVGVLHRRIGHHVPRRGVQEGHPPALVFNVQS